MGHWQISAPSECSLKRAFRVKKRWCFCSQLRSWTTCWAGWRQGAAMRLQCCSLGGSSPHIVPFTFCGLWGIPLPAAALQVGVWWEDTASQGRQPGWVSPCVSERSPGKPDLTVTARGGSWWGVGAQEGSDYEFWSGRRLGGWGGGVMSASPQVLLSDRNTTASSSGRLRLGPLSDEDHSLG